MTGLTNDYYTKQLLTINLGLKCSGEKESAQITMSINNKFVLISSVASHTSVYEVIEKAVQQSLKDIHSDSIDKLSHYTDDSLKLLHLEEKQTCLNDNERIKSSSSSYTRRGVDIDINSSHDVTSRLENIVPDDVIEEQMKIIQKDEENLYPPFDYSPPVEDYNQIPPNGSLEEIFDLLGEV